MWKFWYYMQNPRRYYHFNDFFTFHIFLISADDDSKIRQRAHEVKDKL